MGYNFYLEKHTTLGASRRSTPSEEKRALNESFPRPSVHFEGPTSVPLETMRYKKESLKSRTAKYLKSVWGKITGADRPSGRHSIHPRPVRISNPLRSTVTSLAFASFDEFPDLGHSKKPENGTTSIPVTVDGTIVDHITLPAALASRIVGATVSENMQSIHLTTRAPPTYEQTAPAGNQPFKVCGVFDNDTMQFASAVLSSAEPLLVWPAPNNLYSFGADRPSSVGAIHRNIRMAPGNMIQVPSMYNAGDSYMLAYEGPGGPLKPLAAGVRSSESRLTRPNILASAFEPKPLSARTHPRKCVRLAQRRKREMSSCTTEEGREERVGTVSRESVPGQVVCAFQASSQYELATDYVLQAHDGSDEAQRETDTIFGLEDDCPVFPRLNDYIALVAGATLTAAQAVQSERFDIAICWDGGRHHAHKAHAAGFCYVADCVLCILQLKRTVPGKTARSRVMYLDLDLHHGDGVAEAFTSRPVNEEEDELSTEPGDISPSTVLTISIHHHALGFYPHSALGSLTRAYTADPFALSIPLGRGASASSFARVWRLVERVAVAFFGWSSLEAEVDTGARPAYLVVQCGVDGLAGDPHAVWNWDVDLEREGSMGWCVQRIMHWVRDRARLKAVFLGGGGYNHPNAARAWTYLTSIITGDPLSINVDIPDHAAFLQYAPSFTLDVPAGNMRDENTDQELGHIESTFETLISRIQRAQSPQK
ncbi:hypothetical protein FRC06_001976 [Ceratobasidium sp. 370]|nr:hypothetical protein FRC06_001976 [Ceratobasidium sp. 370]